MCLHNEIWWKREFFVVDSQTPKDWPTANFTGSGLRCSTVNQPAKATPQPSGGGVGWFRCQQLSILYFAVHFLEPLHCISRHLGFLLLGVDRPVKNYLSVWIFNL